MGRRRARGSASGPGQRNPAAAYIRGRHYVATFRAGLIVFGALEFIGGTAAYISSRINVTLGIPTPVVGPVLPLTIAGVLGLVALCVYGVGMRPRGVAASDGARNVAAPRGGARWPGPAAAGVVGVASGTDRVR